jgi:formylglycine-generating enzyme required for sulfatase activity
MGELISERIETIRDQLLSLNRLRGVIDDNLINEKEVELKAQLESLFAFEFPETPSSLDEEGIKSILGARSVVIGGNATGLNIITGDGNKIAVSPEKLSEETLLLAYLRSLANDCGNLPLGVVDPKFARPFQEDRITLTDIYTDLDVTSAPTRGNETRRVWSTRLSRSPGDQRVPLINALMDQENKYAVLLGEAGSGKTTFVNYFTYKTIQSLLKPTIEPVHPSLSGKIIVRIILRNVVSKIPIDSMDGSAQTIWRTINTDIVSRLGELAALRLFPYLQQKLWQDGGIILLDGLDEVPQSERRRKYLIEAVQHFVASLQDNSQVIITARPYAYADPEWHLPSFQVLALAPFSKEQINHFINHWHIAVSELMGWGSHVWEDRAKKLMRIIQKRTYLFDLATRPLLLTLMTTLHTSWGQLPEDRADLYEEVTKLLLSRWERSRETRDIDGMLVIEPGIARVLDMGEGLLRSLLEKLAYQTHQKQKEQQQIDDAPADISTGDILTVFSETLPDDLNPRILLDYLESRSGLLVSRQEGVFSFPHRSFQEYFCACYLTNQTDYALIIRELAWSDPDWWREVCLLAIGKVRQGGLFNSVSLLNVLMPESVNHINKIHDKHWSLAVIVGQALVELRLAERSSDQPYYKTLLYRTVEWLIAAIKKGELAPRERLVAGDSLGQIGDPRRGVGVRKNGKTDTFLPDISWIEIPEGKFIMGYTHDDDSALTMWRPPHEVFLPKYFISRYPITNAQYGLFIKNGGYENPTYWTKAGWDWRNGVDPAFSGHEIDYMDEERENQYGNWLKSRKRKHQPYWWGDPQWGIFNRPVVGINWYEAMAFASWLNEIMQHANLEINGNENLVTRLPSEAEWEKAAKGPMNYKWAWGNEWCNDCANTSEMGLGQTSPVGIFSKGDNHYRLCDMSGNVFEWVTTGLGRTGQHHSQTPRFLYPYDPYDGRENIDALDIRIVRGGAWYFGKAEATCTSREWDYPIVFDQNTGFRVVIGRELVHNNQRGNQK